MICINGLLCEIEKYLELVVNFSENASSCLQFEDDFVAVAETGSALQELIVILHNHGKRWCFEVNVKSVLVYFSKVGKASGGWVWGRENRFVLDS